MDLVVKLEILFMYNVASVNNASIEHLSFPHPKLISQIFDQENLNGFSIGQNLLDIVKLLKINV